MKLKKLTLENYKSHKHYVAEFNGKNSLIEGNKGSGKTSLKDAFTWLLTGAMVDDPTPVDENGEIINHLTIAVEGEFMDGLVLRIESEQKWRKDILQSRHSATYFINHTPCLQKEYLAFLDEKATLQQRKIMLDPNFFATGNGLATTGKPSKTAIEGRREIVMGIAGVDGLEAKIKANEEKAKQAKFAISQLKKDVNDANAGIESLYNAKLDTSHIDEEVIKGEVFRLETELSRATKALNDIKNSDDNHNALQRTLNDATTELSNERAKYTTDYSQRLEANQKPLIEYETTKRDLENRLLLENDKEKQHNDRVARLIVELDGKKKQREELLAKYQELAAKVFVPNSTVCQTCTQPLPADKLVEAEARFNKGKSDDLMVIETQGLELKSEIERLEKELAIKFLSDKETLQSQLNALVRPTIPTLLTFEETNVYRELNQKIANAQKALEDNSTVEAEEIYERTINNLKELIKVENDKLGVFATNKHLDGEIAKVQVTLQDLAARRDEQELILEECQNFTRNSLESLEEVLLEKFEGIRFEMFEYNLDGEAKDTCIVYGLTDNGYIRWESLSGGQKRTSMIKLANAFNKAWGVEIPLWVDDTQIYVEDELNANMQLIRITEVPNAQLTVR